MWDNLIKSPHPTHLYKHILPISLENGNGLYTGNYNENIIEGGNKEWINTPTVYIWDLGKILWRRQYPGAILRIDEITMINNVSDF